MGHPWQRVPFGATLGGMRLSSSPWRATMTVALVLTLAAAGTACGGGDDDDGASAGDTTTTTVEAGTTGTTEGGTVTSGTTATTGPQETEIETTSGDRVAMADTAFDPSTLTVAVGSQVTWTNDDSVPHTTTSDDGVWSSDELDAGASFSHTFDEAGTYTYVCEIHSGMAGEVVVQ